MKQISVTPDSKVSIRADGDSGMRIIEGYASVFMKPSRPIYEQNQLFIEYIAPSAFDNVLASSDINVIMNRDHDDTKMLARKVGDRGSLSLSTDDYGLKYTFVVPNTQLGNETAELIDRGDLYESSFRYSVREGDITWGRNEEGILTRTINEVAGLFDTSVVVTGAFPETKMELRGLDSFIAKEEAEKAERELKRKQELANYYTKLENRIR